MKVWSPERKLRAAPSGNGIRAYRGLAADKSLAALVFQLY